MINEVLKKNLEILKSSNPLIYNKIKAYENGRYSQLSGSVEKILLAREKDLVVNMLIRKNQRDYYLINSENPIDEAYNWIEKYIKPSSGIELIFGIGFGFHLDILNKSFKNKKIVVFEPNMDIFYQIISIRNLTDIFKNVDLFVDDNIDYTINLIKKLYWNTEKTDLQCVPLDIYGDIFPDIWDELREKFIKSVQNFVMDMNTRKALGEQWIKNFILNLKMINIASDATNLYNAFKNIPAILVSAGPSLEKNMKYIKELKGNVLIAAAGTAVNILEKNNITPHIMAGVDASETEANIHRKVKDNSIYLIYTNQISPGSLAAYNGPKFLMDYTYDSYTADFFKYVKKETKSFYSGPSVANTLFDILYKMGCNPIILSGQDLAFSDGNVYAQNERNLTIDIGATGKDKSYVKDIDIHGNEIYTKPDFVVSKNWFEEYFQHLKEEINIINCSGQGLNIKYAVNKSFNEMMPVLISKKYDIGKILKKCYNDGSYEDDIKYSLKKYEEHCMKNINKILKSTLKQNNNLVEMKKGILLKTLDEKRFIKLKNEISMINEELFVSPIYEPILKHIIEIEFFVIKGQFEKKIKTLTNQIDIFNFYKEYINKQNILLTTRLNKVLKYLDSD